jgi:hypothetical protein
MQTAWCHISCLVKFHLTSFQVVWLKEAGFENTETIRLRIYQSINCKTFKKTTLYFTFRNGYLRSVCKENGILGFITLT